MHDTADNADPGHEKHIRDYVVMQQQTLWQLVEGLLIESELTVDEEIGDMLRGFEEPVLTQVAQPRARNAAHAKRQAGQQMQRPGPDEEDRLVILVAVPERQWSSEPVTLRNRLDVEVG
jgi:hypothetical protein